MNIEDSKLSIVEIFREVNATFPRTEGVHELKRQEKKVFGWLCTCVLEDGIQAAAIIPLRITCFSRHDHEHTRQPYGAAGRRGAYS